MKGEFSIMPPSPLYKTHRETGLVRHEVFFGTANRKKSIELGLVVFLTPKMHNMSNEGVHFNREFDLKLKRIGQEVAMKYYNWSINDFIDEFGKNYLEV